MSAVAPISIMRLATSSMSVHQRAVDVIANNIANVNTVGFARSRPEFAEVLSSELGDSAGVELAGVRRLWRQGVVQRTERELDLAVQGDGFFVVRLPTGALGFTRNGSIQRAANGLLVTQDGYPLDPPLSIPAGAERIRIEPDGTVLTQAGGGVAWTEVGRIQLASFANVEGLAHWAHGIFVETEASGPPQLGMPGAEGRGTVLAGALEGSAVDLAEEMVDLVLAERAYSLSVRLAQTADEMQSLANQLVSR